MTFFNRIFGKKAEARPFIQPQSPVSRIVGSNGEPRCVAHFPDTAEWEPAKRDLKLAIALVAEECQKEGFEILETVLEPQYVSEILAEKDGIRCFIFVRCQRYAKGQANWNAEEINACKTLASLQDARCFFASVALMSADGESDEQTSNFFVNYRGLLENI